MASVADVSPSRGRRRTIPVERNVQVAGSSDPSPALLVLLALLALASMAIILLADTEASRAAPAEQADTSGSPSGPEVSLR